jgi:NTP pyrophosphatase (non-canonical NTP hydrolase)
MDMYEQLIQISKGLNDLYPKGNEPFQIITRLCEESGELAKMVNHFEGSGMKNEKYGKPNKVALAKEIQDVLRSALQVALYYDVEDELVQSINQSVEKLRERGQT